MSEKQKVSVIIPAYNMASTLSDAIDSILSQSLKELELIIVDDGSTDKTELTVAEYLKGGKKENPRVFYIFQKNQGRPSALNTGIKRSKGDYITFLDADDMLIEDSLKKRAEALDENPHIGMVYADAHYTDSLGNVYKRRKSREFKNNKQLLTNLVSCPSTPIINPTIMVRREVFYNLGGYNAVYRRAQDIEMHMRILLNYDVLYLPINVLCYRTYLRRSKILRLRFDTIKSWYLIFDTYIISRRYRILLKVKRTFFELMKLSYEFFIHRK